MKNGDNVFKVIVDRNEPYRDFTVRADECEIGPDGTLMFLTYRGPRSGRMIVKARSPGNWEDVEFEGEHRD